MKTLPKFFNRNIGFLNESEQGKLAESCVAIAGAGGDGGLLAERLIRFGIGKIILADPETFEENNINRQFAADTYSFGKNKAEVVAEHLRRINPYATIEVHNDGLNEHNVESIVSAADAIVDEIEFSVPKISVLLHSHARRANKNIFMGANIGWGATMFCFSPSGLTFEEFFEFDGENINPLKYISEKPSYISDHLISEIVSGKIPVPSLSSSVGLVASIISSGIVLYLTGKKIPEFVPNFLSLDLYTGELKKISHEITD